MRNRCNPIPRAWPADADASQALTEKYLQRDQADTSACANAALRYVNRTEARDRDLTKAAKL